MSDLVRFGVSVNKQLVEKFDSLIAERGYKNRSEALRDLIRSSLVEEEWRRGKEAVGVITLVYNHEQKELSHKLIHLQHHFESVIISSLHAHLDGHNCLEAIVLRGKSEELKKIADLLISTKGVKHGKLVATTTGKELK